MPPLGSCPNEREDRPIARCWHTAVTRPAAIYADSPFPTRVLLAILRASAPAIASKFGNYMAPSGVRWTPTRPPHRHPAPTLQPTIRPTARRFRCKEVAIGADRRNVRRSLRRALRAPIWRLDARVANLSPPILRIRRSIRLSYLCCPIRGEAASSRVSPSDLYAIATRL